MSEKNVTNQELAILEESLRSSLHPIEPDQIFVKQLRNQLENSPEFGHNLRLAKQILTVAVGLLVGFAIFIIGRDMIEETH
ncbi:MAG: hypothetical protein ACK2TV_06650 [Anaerolineales bacterium]